MDNRYHVCNSMDNCICSPFRWRYYNINCLLLSINLLLVIAQIMNVFMAFREKQNDVGVRLLVCLFITLALMWITYIDSWNYTVKAMTIGFE